MSTFLLCVRCGEPLYGFSPCRWYTCERCGIDLLNGIFPLCNSSNSCAYDHNPNPFDYPSDSYHPPHPIYETYSGDTCGNDSHFGYDCPPRFPLNYEPERDTFKTTILIHTIHRVFHSNILVVKIAGLLMNLTNEFIKSSVENLVPNPSEFEGENECDVPAGFTTFSNVLFDAEYAFNSSDDQSFSDEDLPEKIYSNPFFDEEIIPMKIDPHSFNAEYDLIESMPNHDSSKIDSLFDELPVNSLFSNQFHRELMKLIVILRRKLILPRDCYGNTGILNIKMIGDISDQKVPIPNLMITRVSSQGKSPDLLPHQGLEAFQSSAECPMMINGKNTPILDVPLFHFYPLDQLKYGRN
nr:hypothetical protein [Tanacetum cinerariifolium]